MIFEYEKIENDTTLVKGMKLSCHFSVARTYVCLSLLLHGFVHCFSPFDANTLEVFNTIDDFLSISETHISRIWFYFLWLFNYVSDNFHWTIACNVVCYTAAEFWNSLCATLRRRTGEVFSMNLPFPDISSHRESQCSNEISCIAFKIKTYNSRWFESKTVWT